MSQLGKTIEIYLKDGSASGVWQATLSNWDIIAYKIPRVAIKNCDNLENIHTPGVYFLFGTDDDSERDFIYVGESDDTLTRILQPHTFDKDDKCYWTEAVVFVSTTHSLDKARVKYLENRFYLIAEEAKRYKVKNGNKPKQSPVPQKVQDLLEEFILNAQLVILTLGHTAFEPSPSLNKDVSAVESELLYFSKNNGKSGKATGRITSEGFWVLKGSYINPDETAKYAPPGIKKAREKYKSVIKNGYLQEDICFGSPSYAAAFVFGKNANGLKEWKNIDGITLKELDSNDENKNESKQMLMKQQIAENESETLYLTTKKVQAKGKIVSNGFVVLKGSYFYESETESCSMGTRKIRSLLIKEGKIKSNIFMEDVLFDSPSAAASCIIGGSANGLLMWRYSDGKSIKEKNSN